MTHHKPGREHPQTHTVLGDLASGNTDLGQTTLPYRLRSLTASPMSPWVDEAESHTRNWVRSFGLVRSERAKERFDCMAAAGLAARSYASAVGQSDLAIATDWISWLFLLDDQLDEGSVGRDLMAASKLLRPLAKSLAEQPARRSRYDSPLQAALDDLWSRMAPSMPATWRARFIRDFADYLSGCEWEVANRASGRIPSLEEYPPGHRRTGALWPALDMLEFVTHDPLPDLVYSNPLFAELRNATADVVCWTNDVLTVDKERARGDVHNFVIVLEHTTGCTTDTATAQVAQYIDRRLTDFMERERRLPDLLDAMRLEESTRHTVNRNVAGLRDWMRGHLDWGLETLRYHSVEHTAAGVEPSYLERL